MHLIKLYWIVEKFDVPQFQHQIATASKKTNNQNPPEKIETVLKVWKKNESRLVDVNSLLD